MKFVIRLPLGVMKISKAYVPIPALEKVYISFVRSKLEYGDVLYHINAFQKETISTFASRNRKPS